MLVDLSFFKAKGPADDDEVRFAMGTSAAVSSERMVPERETSMSFDKAPEAESCSFCAVKPV